MSNSIKNILLIKKGDLFIKKFPFNTHGIYIPGSGIERLGFGHVENSGFQSSILH